MAGTIRKASHAGSWYTADGVILNRELSGWLKTAVESKIRHAPARAIIAPHAGFSYSGPCAAFAYSQIDPSSVKRVFLLGPSHHVHVDGCALSLCSQYATPLGNIPIDQKTVAELKATKKFQDMTIATDEDEHSLEMHLPYIAKVMESRAGSYALVPVLVGNINKNKEKEYGEIFRPYLEDPSSLFVISSDFCHWGKRFSYTFTEPAWGEIHESIEKLDRMGMNLIETLNPADFRAYLDKYGNTICGRNPILVLLGTVETVKKNSDKQNLALKFVQYAQSSPCKTTKDSSVSYASASLTFN
ncbi:Protein MEMO1 [Hypsibius exemplaris]|uniref:Protein MEMO1 n=1 Tax=Hypsibius exemplaris TaxID=2072580 RepID=A0A1W0X6P1_HYPEX|nr:Protein MEMO1 [Hypsibius exemplaris]